jgi:hypothetical protein
MRPPTEIVVGVQMIRRNRGNTVTAIGFALCALFPLKTRAQEAPTNPCWEVIAAGPNVAQRFPILINKCTGKTWLLTKVEIREGKSGLPGAYAYRWRPISTDDNGEVTISTLP